jgi:hypothetical protein
METVEIDKLNANDRTYCISYPLEDGLLFSSVADFGVLCPLSLLGREHPVVVTGFKRLNAAQRAGAREVPCVYLDIPRKQALLTSIMDNLQRPLNIVEKASCVERMQAIGFDAEEMYRVMKLLGLRARDETLKAAVMLAGAETGVKDLIAGINPPMGVVEQLFWFDAGEVGQIVGCAARLRMSMSNFRETMALLMLLKVKQGRIDGARLDEAGSIDALKQTVRRATHPGLVGMEAHLARLLGTAALPPNIRIKVDPNFERDAVDISIQAATDGEMDDALRRLRDMADRGIFRSILELTHGGPAHN